MTAIVRTRELVRRFGSAVALDGIDLEVATGERNASGRLLLRVQPLRNSLPN